MKRAIIFASVLIFSLAFVSGALAQEIKVGTLLAHTGPLKEFGPAIKNGTELAAKQLADAGFKMKLIHEDSETSAIPRDFRPSVPLKITSSIREPLSASALCSPNTQRMASTTFVFPQPLGPTTATVQLAE